MASYELNDLEADEVFHALVERKSTLEKRVKSLGEQDGLPEAAEAVRKRISLYMPTGQEGDDYRPGLVRLFAPQRELDAERDEQRKDEERDPNGQQDIFGGGAETGGRKRKKGAAAETPPAEPPTAPAAEATEEPAAPPAPADPVELALEQLASLAADLVKGEEMMEPDIYRGYAVPVLELLPKINGAFDVDYLRTHINQELSGNAHALSHFISRQVDQVREARERPIGRREEAHATDAIEGTNTPEPVGNMNESSPIPDSALESVDAEESPEGEASGVGLASEPSTDSSAPHKPKRGKKRP